MRGGEHLLDERGGLLIAQGRFRSRLGQFKLCAHFLQASTKSFNLLLLVRDVRLELLLLLCRSRLEIFPLLRDGCFQVLVRSRGCGGQISALSFVL